MSALIRYSIKPSNPHAHLYSVTLEITQPASGGQLLRMPAWIPGSYMIREFAKNVVEIHAQDHQGATLRVSKQDKSTWCVHTSGQTAILVEYSVYAWDLSVRSAHLDQTHAYFNGTSVFLEVIGQHDLPCEVDILNADIPEASDWRVATTLLEAGAERYGFGTYAAKNYDDLIDHPVEIADFTLGEFIACGVPHELVLSGKHYADVKRICDDLQKICEHHIRFFGEPAPMDRYLFITWVVGNGYGGLEHRSSTSLICKRDDLPGFNAGTQITDDYQNFLGLCSHEYFHTWNVKRIKPSVYIPYDLSQETHTELLWAFEGITSYYDDLGVIRSGLIDIEQYLKVLARTYTRVHRAGGRLKQSVAASSFDTWTKFYKQDENAVNAIVNYYTKGALSILAIDLKIRALTQHQKSFNDVMIRMWHDYLGQTQNGGDPVGIKNGDIESIALDLLDSEDDKAELEMLMNQLLRGVNDIDYIPLLEFVGVKLNTRYRSSWNDAGGVASKAGDQSSPWLGAMLGEHSMGAKITHIFADKAASVAGLSSGDIVIAVDGVQVSAKNIEKMFANFSIGQEVNIHAFRDDLLMEFNLQIQEPEEDTYYFTVVDEDKCKLWINS